MGHIIVGTAGHVDHGKTALTARLTGINTDRLPEEKKRGMTIELGFVPLVLPDGQRLGLIDVPGHEKFVKNMLAGVAGIDMVLLVVAADEGVMPQTREHLHIIHLLGIDKGVVAITKSDLAESEEWLDLIREQVRELTAPTSLKDAPIVACSALTGHGIDELLGKLSQVAASVESKPTSGHYRLPVDRVFSKSGFGTVVTGTLWMGKLRVGDTVQIWPGGRKARVRGLQVHGQPVEESQAGTRTAVNVAGIDTEEAPRSSWLASPGLLRESYRLDVELRLLADAKALPQRCRVHIHHGTAQALGRVDLLDREELQPGAACYCQLALEEPLPPLRGDRLIIRSYSPMHTIGGATVLDANPPKHKRYQDQVIQQLKQRAAGDPEAALLDVLGKEAAPVTIKTLAKDAQTPADELCPLLASLQEQRRLYLLEIDGDTQYLLPERAERLLSDTLAMLADYHGKYPLRAGVADAELRSRLFPKYTPKQLAALLTRWQEEGYLQTSGSLVSKPGFSPRPTAREQAWLDQLSVAYQAGAYEPPDWAEITAALQIPPADAAELLLYLGEQGIVIRCGEILFAAEQVDKAVQTLKERYGNTGFTLAEARDALGSSRKFILPLLEYLDNHKITKRIEDQRVFL